MVETLKKGPPVLSGRSHNMPRDPPAAPIRCHLSPRSLYKYPPIPPLSRDDLPWGGLAATSVGSQDPSVPNPTELLPSEKGPFQQCSPPRSPGSLLPATAPPLSLCFSPGCLSPPAVVNTVSSTSSPSPSLSYFLHLHPPCSSSILLPFGKKKIFFM